MRLRPKLLKRTSISIYPDAITASQYVLDTVFQFGISCDTILVVVILLLITLSILGVLLVVRPVVGPNLSIWFIKKPTSILPRHVMFISASL